MSNNVTLHQGKTTEINGQQVRLVKVGTYSNGGQDRIPTATIEIVSESDQDAGE